MDTHAIISIFSVLVGVTAILCGRLSQAQSMTRQTIKDLQDEIKALKDRVKEVESSYRECKESERALTAENLDLRHRIDRQAQRIEALEAVR